MFSSESRLQFLLSALVALIVVYPLIERVLVLNVLLTLLLCTSVLAVGTNRRQQMIAVALGLPYLVVLWLYLLGVSHPIVALLGPLLGMVFLGYVTFVLVRHVAKADEVDAEMIYGAIAGYLLIGVIWAMAYLVVETLYPGSFAFSEGDVQPWDDLLYYSFVTLTTLGYGDLLPLTPQVRSLAILEAVTGVFYVAVFVARLVSLHIIHQTA